MCLKERKSADKCRHWFEAQQACQKQGSKIRDLVVHAQTGSSSSTVVQ